jgi:hypothetical protein
VPAPNLSRKKQLKRDRLEGRGAGTEASKPKKTLAEKTEDLRGAVKGELALARSCADQQNPPLNSLSLSTRSVSSAMAKETNPILAASLQILGSL